MTNREIDIRAVFSCYTPIKEKPHFVFIEETRYLVDCEGYSEWIGRLCPGTEINIRGDIGAILPEGKQLLNPQFILG